MNNIPSDYVLISSFFLYCIENKDDIRGLNEKIELNRNTSQHLLNKDIILKIKNSEKAVFPNKINYNSLLLSLMDDSDILENYDKIIKKLIDLQGIEIFIASVNSVIILKHDDCLLNYFKLNKYSYEWKPAIKDLVKVYVLYQMDYKLTYKQLCKLIKENIEENVIKQADSEIKYETMMRYLRNINEDLNITKLDYSNNNLSIQECKEIIFDNKNIIYTNALNELICIFIKIGIFYSSD